VNAWPRASLHLDAGRDFRGGQRQVLALVRGLAARGQRVQLCCPHTSPLFAAATAAGVPCRALTLRSGFDFPSAVRLARWVRDLDVDLVHVHDARSHGIARVAQGMSRHRGLAANLFVTRRNVGVGTTSLDRLKYVAPGTSFVAISNAVRESLLRVGVDPGRVMVVPSGIDVERFAAANPNGDDPWELRRRGAWVIGCVGQLSREKNHAVLLAAFARVAREAPQAHLLLVGDGPLRGALERQAGTLGVRDRVTFTGRLDDVVPAYRSLAVFALASDREGLCTSILDAMAAGVPVVTTAAGGVLEIARHGESALVVPTREPAALAGALQLIRQQPELAARLVAGGRRVAAGHSLERMVEGTLEAYARLGNAPSGDPSAGLRSPAAPLPSSEGQP
jgi:glycosyltransferase involved in cell wall biosynthesis